MHSVRRAADPGVMAPTQMIWLPGAYHLAQNFLEQGFVRAVQARRIPMDLTFVDLEMQHLDDREAFERLRSEIVLPAGGSGRSVWLAGISLGGMIALDYLSCHPHELHGVCVFAPYLGNRMLAKEIVDAPGLTAWNPGELAPNDAERRIWRYIKDRDNSRPLYLGFGKQDRFAAAQALLASALPRESVNIIDGGHDWRTWTKLWGNFLDSQFE
jgi:pimeloyl-ACP methyl ester carboxylesterase